MATERIVDLEGQRYADRPYEGAVLASAAEEEQRRAGRQHLALARLKIRAAGGDAVLADLLTVLGLDE